MKNLIIKIWRAIGGVWGSMTALLFVLAVSYLHHPFVEKLDGIMFAIDAQFVATPDLVEDIAVMHMPKLRLKSSDQPDYRLLLKLLDELAKDKPLAIALILNVPKKVNLNTTNTLKYLDKLDQIIKDMPANKKREFVASAAFSEQALFADSVLVKSLKKKNLFIAQKKSEIEALQFDQAQVLKQEHYRLDSSEYFNKFEDFVLPKMSKFDNTEVIALDYVNVAVERNVNETAYRSLVWSANNKVLPDVLTLLYSKLIGSKNPVWKTGLGLEFETDYRPTDWAGRVLPRSSAFTGIDVEYKKISYFDVLNKKLGKQLKNKIVILGYEGDPVVDDIAGSLTSLYTDSVYYSPVWADFLVLGLLIAILIYGLFLLPRMQIGVGVILSLFLVFALLVGQMGLLLVKQVWAPITMVVVFLLITHALSLIRRSIAGRFDNLQKQVYEAFWMLGVYQFEQGEYDQSFASLQKCPTTDPTLEQMYRIGQAYEKRRQYTKALDLYRELNTRRPGYKSADKRIKSLVQLEEDQSGAVAGFSSARTLIVTNHGLQKPVLGRYELVRELGRGAMGVVYLGQDPKINRQVAIKTMDMMQYDDNEHQLIRERFFKEAETAGRLSHPNIVTIYDVGEEQDLAFIAMDYVVGQVMSDFVRKGRLLPIDMVFKLMRQVAIALDYAHKQGVVHRDIKPSNIMYNTDEQVIKVTDFGIARAAGATGTNTGSILGSPLYMAPEQLSGIKVDGRADLFSLGVSMYQLLTGELPFQGDTLASLAYQVTNVKHQPIREHRSDLPPLTTRLINKLLQKDPDKRFASGKDVAAAIIKVLATIEQVPVKKTRKSPAQKK